MSAEMTDQQKLEEAANMAYQAVRRFIAVPNNLDNAAKVWRPLVEQQRTFWASHAEPEMGLPEVLRRVAEYVRAEDMAMVAPGWFEQEADRLDADSQQRDRDMRVGTAVCGAIASCISFPDDELIGRIAREVVGAEK